MIYSAYRPADGLVNRFQLLVDLLFPPVEKLLDDRLSGRVGLYLDPAPVEQGKPLAVMLVSRP